MGYYSDIALCLNKNGKEILDQKLQDANPDLQKEVKDLLAGTKNHLVNSQTSSELWAWEMLKWYADFPEVSFIEKLLAEMDVDNFLFVRIGEDSDDNGILGSYHDNPFGLYLSKTISFS